VHAFTPRATEGYSIKETWALQTRFGLEGVVDLTATIGYYAMIACALNAFAVEPSPGEPPLPV
jgi:hypothetical protein